MRTAGYIALLIVQTAVLWPLSLVSEQANIAFTFGPYAAWQQIKATMLRTAGYVPRR